MTMTGPLVLILLMLISFPTNFTDCADIGLNDPGNNWKKRFDYGQYGHQIFPDKDGCGGVIDVTEDYQHGVLTSPNWPGPLPSHANCVWKLFGLTNFFFVVKAFPRDSEKQMEQSSGILTVKNLAMEKEELFYMGGYDYHRVTFLNNSLQSFEIRMTANVYTSKKHRPKGFKLTWWTVPRADFSKIYTSDQWRGREYKDEELLTVGNKNTISYVFINYIGPSTASLQLFAEEGGKSLPCNDKYKFFSIIRFDNQTKSAYVNPCKPKRNQFFIDYKADGAALVGIQITIPEKVSLKYSITGSRSEERPSWNWVHTECPVRKASIVEGVGYIDTENFNSSNEPYPPKRQCHDYIQISPAVHDVFMQVSMQTDIQPSPSCVADYLKIGSQRVCGINGPDTYISSPVDNSLIDRTRTYYINIVPNNASVNASVPASETHTAHLAINAIPSQCYSSHPSVSSPYWVLDLEDIFTVRGVRILPEPIQNATIAVYVKSDDADIWPVPSFQTCMHNQLPFGIDIIRCYPLVSGRYLAIFQSTANLTLCTVQVFANIASPVKSWKNAVLGNEPEINIRNTGVIKHVQNLVDGRDWFCTGLFKYMKGYMKFTFSDGELIVHAVMLYIKNNASRVKFDSYAKSYWHMGSYYKGNPYTCVNYTGKPGIILLSCQKPLRTKELFIANMVNITNLCEIIVYADTEDQMINYAALHKGTVKSLLSMGSNLTSTVFVDGKLTSCDSTDRMLFLDLGNLHLVEGLNLYTGDQNGSVFVRLWIFAEINQTTDSKILCTDYLVDGPNQYHLRVQHNNLKLSFKCTRPKVGRYVVLFITKDTASELHLCEVQVIAAPYDNTKSLQNVALFKHTRLGPKSPALNLSETPDVFYYGHAARQAVDGVRTKSKKKLTCTTVLAEQDTGAWWEVDLANIYEVHTVRRFLCSDRDNTSFTIYVFLSREMPPKSYYISAFTEHISINPSVPGRIVQLISSQDMCLCEVEVMAKPLLSYKRFEELPELINDRLTQKISFVTDALVQKKGFSASYKINNLRDFTSFAECGELVRQAHETLTSPNFPETYALPDDNYICHWMVPTSFDGFTMVIVDYFHLTPEMPEGQCFHDVLIISNSAGQQITKCGFMSKQALSIQSFKNDYLHVTLIVRSVKPFKREIRARRGFKLRFEPYMSCAYQLIHLSIYATGYLSSPLYPKSHPPFAWCSWTMTAYTMGMLNITIMKLDLHRTQEGCENEVLMIDTTGQKLQTFCGRNASNTPLNIPLQTGDIVTIIFRSKHNMNRKGFLLFYSFSPYLEINRTVLSYQVIHESLGYPNAYDPENVSLTWTFTTLNDSGKIHVHFTDLDLWPNGSSVPGSAHFTVDNYLAISSKRLLTLKTGTYDDNTKQGDRHSTFEVYPQSVFELKFKPDPKKGKHEVRFQFSIKFDPDARTAGDARVFVGVQQHITYEKQTLGFRFHKIEAKENMPAYEQRYVYITKNGLYLVSIRVMPLNYADYDNLELLLNLKPTGIVGYSHRRDVGSVTAALKLDAGDMLSVVNKRGLGLDALSMFIVVYISPVEGGFAFTGLETGDNFNWTASLMRFQPAITNAGHASEKNSPMYNKVIAPVTGIYWVTIRARETQSQVTLFKGNRATFLEVYREGRIPVSASAAIHFCKGDDFSVSHYSGPLQKTPLSVVLLAYNKKPDTGDKEHIAFTAIAYHTTLYEKANQTVAFKKIEMNYGVTVKGNDTFIVPMGGLYLVSIRGDPARLSSGECLRVVLLLKASRKFKFVSIATDNNPAGQMTVVRLKTNDTLTVLITEYTWVDRFTMFSFAFVHH